MSSSRDRRGASARAGAAVLRRAAGRLRGSGSARWWAILAVVTALALTGLILPGGDGRQPGAHPLRLHETTQAGDTRLNALPGATATCTGLQSSLTPSNSNAGPAVQKILKRGKLIAGIDTNSYLWGFRDPTSGSLEGFDIDIVHALAKSILGDAGKVEYKAVPTAQRISALRSGEVDVVVRTMSITCDRLKQVAFSEPYFNSGQQLLVPKSSGIKGLGSGLKGKRVCAATGSSAQTLLNQNGNYGARVVPVANQLDCLVLMQLGKVDATLTDNALAAGQAAQDPTVHLVGTPEMIEPYGVAMNRNATDLVRRVNAVLQGYRSGQWTSSYDHWLASRLGPTTGPPAVRYAG